MKKMIIAAAMFLLGGTAHAVSTTTILGLTLPAFGSYRWDLPMNANSQLIDSLVAVKAATQTFTGANTFVSTSNVYYGSGSNLSGVATSAQLTSTAAALSSEITRATARENAIAVSTGVLQADLATEVSRATLRENDIAVSTGIIYSALNSTAAALSAEITRATNRENAIAVSTGALEASKVNRAGDTMTGPLTLAGSSLTVRGSAFSVGGSTFSCALGKCYFGGTANPQTPVTSYAERVNPSTMTSGGNINFYTTSALQLQIGAHAAFNGWWIQTKSAAAPGVAYGLHLNPNGGNVGIGLGETMDATGLFQVGGNKLFVNGTTGSVGIGTTAPGSKLHVVGDATMGSTTVSSLTATTGDYQLSLGLPSVEYKMGRNSGTGLFTFYGNQAGYDSYSFSGASGEKMRITSAGKVGIGTSTPGELLEISAPSSATLRFTNSINGAAGAFYPGQIQGKISYWTPDVSGIGPHEIAAIVVTNEQAAPHATPGGDISFRTSFSNTVASEVMRISAGSVGIGTVRPGAKLDVDGSISGTNIFSSGTVTAISFSGSGVGLTGLPGGGDAVLAATQTWTGQNTFSSATSTTTFSGAVDIGLYIHTYHSTDKYGRAACNAGYRAIGGGCSGSSQSLFYSMPITETSDATASFGTPVADGGTAYGWGCAVGAASLLDIHVICARIK